MVDGGRDGFDLAKTVADLRERGFLPQGNRTDVTKDIFESGTGELYLGAESKRMEVRTPRFQGLCTEAGGSASFPNFEVLKTNRNGCFALASIDDSKDLGSAERLLLFAVTNALNSGSIFENADQRVKLVNGDVPILVESGEFEFKIRTPLASTLMETRSDSNWIPRNLRPLPFTLNSANSNRGNRYVFIKNGSHE